MQNIQIENLPSSNQLSKSTPLSFTLTCSVDHLSPSFGGKSNYMDTVDVLLML